MMLLEHIQLIQPGSGVLAEVYTTSAGISNFKMTPAVGWNDDATPSDNIYTKVTNTDASNGRQMRYHLQSFAWRNDERVHRNL